MEAFRGDAVSRSGWMGWSGGAPSGVGRELREEGRCREGGRHCFLALPLQLQWVAVVVLLDAGQQSTPPH